ncbi:MAG: hypothetical protein FJW27_18565 [Acidimicrobiia bacterium]|nr:hypothetical protein [Acidimicrobiia bacterium]
MLLQPDRLVVCLPDGEPAEALLVEAARFADHLPGCGVEIVAAPVHGLHDAARGLLRSTFRRGVDNIHLVPTANETVDLGVQLADRSTLIVTRGRGGQRLPKRPEAWTLMLQTPIDGRSVMAIVDPLQDTPATIVTAMDLAERLGASRVVACHLYFDEGAAANDAWERRASEERTEAVGILLARVPAHDAVTVVPRIEQSPWPERSLLRIATEEGASLVVGSPTRLVEISTLCLPEAIARRSTQPSALRALWDGLLDGPESLPALS